MTGLLWDTWDYLAQGGWVMVPIGMASVFMWVMILERWRTYRGLSGHDIEPADALRALSGGVVPEGRNGLRRALLERFLAGRIGLADTDRSVLHVATEAMRRELRKRIAAIAVLAAIAPLLGLLGTVLGMIQTFDVIAVFGTGNARAMAGGISVALVTTQAGLVVAIPGLFISHALTRRAGRLESGLDEFSLALDRVLKLQALPAHLEASAR